MTGTRLRRRRNKPPPEFDHSGQANDEMGIMLRDIAQHLRGNSSPLLYELEETYEKKGDPLPVKAFIVSILEEAASRLGSSEEYYDQ